MSPNPPNPNVPPNSVNPGNAVPNPNQPSNPTTNPTTTTPPTQAPQRPQPAPPGHVRVEGSMHIARIAQEHGFANWRTLWDQNPELAARRKFPFQLFHGDSVKRTGDFVKVSKDKKQESAQTEKYNKFEMSKDKVQLRLRFLDENLKPLAKTKYELWIDGKQNDKWKIIERNGKKIYEKQPQFTDERGVIEEDIPFGSIEGWVIVQYKVHYDGKDHEIPMRFNLSIGRLDPISDKDAPDVNCLPGIQARLNNLSFDCGMVDGLLGPHTKNAIMRFRKRFDIQPYNELPDEQTRVALTKYHDTAAPIPENIRTRPMPTS